MGDARSANLCNHYENTLPQHLMFLPVFIDKNSKLPQRAVLQIFPAGQIAHFGLNAL